MTQYDQTWDELQKVLDNITYMDFSRFWLERDDESNHAVLCVLLHAPNSYHGEIGDRPDRPTRHEFLVPCATYDYENWRRWVREQLCSTAIHEVDEWFMDSGVRVFPPHHGNGEIPYVSWTNSSHSKEQALAAPGEDYRDYLPGGHRGSANG